MPVLKQVHHLPILQHLKDKKQLVISSHESVQVKNQCGKAQTTSINYCIYLLATQHFRIQHSKGTQVSSIQLVWMIINSFCRIPHLLVGNIATHLHCPTGMSNHLLVCGSSCSFGFSCLDCWGSSLHHNTSNDGSKHLAVTSFT